MSHKGLDVYVLEGGIPNISSEAAGTENSDDHAAENQMAPGVGAAQEQELESLCADNEQLRGELGESNDKLIGLYAQTKEDAELLKQLRGELCESGEKLCSLYAQMKGDAKEMQLLQDQYTALQEQHADVVSAHKLELEQLEEQKT